MGHQDTSTLVLCFIVNRPRNLWREKVFGAGSSFRIIGIHVQL